MGKNNEMFLYEQMRFQGDQYRLNMLQEASTLEYMEVDTKPISKLIMDALTQCGWVFESSEPYSLIYRRHERVLKVNSLTGIQTGNIQFPINMPDDELIMILHLFKIIDLKTIKYACRGNGDNGNHSSNWMGGFISNQLNQE